MTTAFSVMQHAVKSCGMTTSYKVFLEGVLSVYGLYGPWNDFELIPAVKMETRHPVEG